MRTLLFNPIYGSSNMVKSLKAVLRRLGWLPLCFFTFFTFGLANADSKVLLLGIDGVQLEEMQKLNTPNIKRLNITKAYTGGVTGTFSEQKTNSGPGWSTILTGVWANKHAIWENSSGAANPLYPSLFKRIRDARPDAYIASIAHWGTPNTTYFASDVITNNITINGINDDSVTQKVIELIQTTPADFIFAHLDDPDHYSHKSCFGSDYDASLVKADAQLGLMLDAIEAQANQNNDDWLMLVTTDHGRQPILGCGHGNQSEQEKTIFIASNKTMNAEFTQHTGDIARTDFNGLYGYASQASIAPTVLRHLDITIDPNWKLDGMPLLGEEGVRKLMLASHNSDFTWWENESHTIDIYRNGQWIDSINSLERQWTDASAANGLNEYVFVKNNVPVAIQLNRVNLNAAVSWNAFRGYFFRSDLQYIRYSKTLDRTDNGYPKPTNEKFWPGLGQYAHQLAAAFSKNSNTSYYFLDNGQYIRYNNILDRADSGYPKPINNDTWPGLAPYATQIAATLKWSNDKVYFFLKNGEYLRYDLGDDQVDSGYPKPINNATWPGLEGYAMDITSAFHWNNNRAYFFLTGQRYIRYNIADDRAEDGYPVKINNVNWPGVLNP